VSGVSAQSETFGAGPERRNACLPPGWLSLPPVDLGVSAERDLAIRQGGAIEGHDSNTTVLSVLFGPAGRSTPLRNIDTVAAIARLPLGAERRLVVSSGRPVPLHGEAAGVLIDFSRWDRRALSDGRIDQREACEGIGIMRRLASTTRVMAVTLEHFGTCCGSPNGIFGTKAVRGFNEAQRRRNAGNVIAFPEQDGDEVA